MTDDDVRLEDPFLTEGVLTRRAVGWCIDLALIALMTGTAWVFGLMFGVLTLGLGLPLLLLLPALPFAYNLLCLAWFGATPGQSLVGLAVRDVRTLEAPDMAQALISTIGYYVTLATSGLLLIVALLTPHGRTLHDVVSGLVVVRSGRIRAGSLTRPGPAWNMRGRTT